MFFLEVSKEILTIENVTVFGIMLVVILGLSWFIKYLLKRIDDKDGQIVEFTRKYYNMAGQLRDFLDKNKSDV